ncbi:hypothetical protein Bp8pS_149 [Bacillus phage vB_BpuM-BpSp]|nr:hypothetical protein Bp8pS_149 [Bacillus phage vB_BpuM-BpSp]
MENFSNKVNSLDENFIFIEGDYTSFKDTKIKVMHRNCKSVFEIKYKSFKRRQKCPNCLPNRKSNLDEFKRKLSDYSKGKIIVLDDNYKNNRTPLMVMGRDCGHKWSSRPDNLLKGHGCPKCNGGSRINHEDFIFEVNRLTNNEYEVIGSYINNKTKITLRHKICDNNWEVTPLNFIHNYTRCPFCKKTSKGESAIIDWLDKNKFDYEREFTIDKCKNKNKLRFDFMVKIDDIFCLIEFDGKQHFKTGGFFDEEYMSKIKNNDLIKNNFCQKNNIPLLRINYLEINNIDNILDKFINNVQRLSKAY